MKIQKHRYFINERGMQTRSEKTTALEMKVLDQQKKIKDLQKTILEQQMMINQLNRDIDEHEEEHNTMFQKILLLESKNRKYNK